jgi:hypothetical protein
MRVHYFFANEEAETKASLTVIGVSFARCNLDSGPLFEIEPFLLGARLRMNGRRVDYSFTQSCDLALCLRAISLAR